MAIKCRTIKMMVLFSSGKDWDPNRMMMFGWSYGGYAPCCCSKDPRFISWIAGATVPDLIDQVMTQNQLIPE